MREPDPYSSLAEKYRFILQLADGAPLVLRGPYWTDMAGDFSRIGYHPDVADAQDLTALPPCATVLIDSPPDSRPDAAPLAGALSNGGVLAVLWRSRGRPWFTWPAFRRHLGEAGVLLHEFRAVPDLPSVEAFVGTRDAHHTWRLARHGIRVAVRNFVRRPEQQRFLFAAARNRHTGFAEAAHCLHRATGEYGFEVERYHLRRRGALVMVLRRAKLRRVLRVATNPVVSGLVSRNHECTAALLSRADLPDGVRRLIPQPLGRDFGAQADVFIEEYRDGRLAWTLYRTPQLQLRLDQQLFRFTHDMQLATRRSVTMEEGTIESLSGHYLAPLLDRYHDDHRMVQCLQVIRHCLARRLNGRTLFCSVSHGDFGVGNALATQNGALSAIIDWDQYFANDIPGVDWCDYQLKAAHYRQSLIQGVEELVAQAAASGYVASRYRGFGPHDFGLSKADMRLVPCLAALRELARSARFPAESAALHSDSRKALENVARLLHEES